ncbi:uncharacterized protein [Typha latifolia]|uniref:uncharacterized protein isoform X2 n=1 Tax=Typha latifolia TaxID=4733 RepID=UPI003C2D7289
MRKQGGDGGVHVNISNPARMSQIRPSQASASFQVDTASPSVPPPPTTTTVAATVAKLLFFAHLLAIVILITFLAIHSSLHRRPVFRPINFFPPLLASVGTSSLLALLALVATLRHQVSSLKTSLWLSPMLSCGAAVLLLASGTSVDLAVAAVAIVLTVTQSLYACWVVPRLHHAYDILYKSIELSRVPLSTIKYVAVAFLAGISYASLWVIGVGGVTADKSSRFAPLYVVVLLLSLTWTMQVIKYAVHVAVARLAHAGITTDDGSSASEAFWDATTRALGDVCMGAAAAPFVTTARASARAMGLLTGDSDEFLFSCTSCCLGMADSMVTRGNRWGFVHVGAYQKGFGDASRVVWDLFAKQGMRRLVDLDLTGSFCFLAATGVGSAAAIVAGSWMMAVEKRYATATVVYAFFAGYFLTRIAMAWPQACVAAYHVAYAENPQNQELGSFIPGRIRELQLSP